MLRGIKSDIFASILSLKSNLLRSFLTTLGIIFGVAAVIAMMSIGEGAREELIQQIKLLGLNNVIIENNEDVETSSNNNNGSQKTRGLYYKDKELLENKFTEFTVISEISEKYPIIIEGTRTELEITATDSEFPIVNNMHISNGRFFSRNDNDTYKRVCVITASLARKYYVGENPVGNDIKIGKQWYTVIGVINTVSVKGASKIEGVELKDFDQTVFIPIKTGMKRITGDINSREIDKIVVQIPDEKLVYSYSKVIQSTISQVIDEKKFKMIIPQDLLAQSQETQNIFNIVMGTIASISLLVGGIGIMNIMLANALERRKEIGIRRAIGATRKNILLQFIIESSLISFMGGIIGIIIGYVMTYFITRYAGWETSVTISSIFVSFVVSVGVGMIFGILPARKAAQLSPIEALRYE